MTCTEKISKVLGFRTLPTTIFASLIYLAVFVSVLVTDELPNVPRNQGGLDLEQAYQDLHEIAARPHQYNSHANDVVRSYLLSRVQDISKGHHGVHISNDIISNGSWAAAAYGVYFEGTNILVRIDGTDPNFSNTGGVLFSAHYDSVSTAPGATDDGMGVATLLQLITYFAAHRPKRTVVFNINNGEEDWLNGAHAFLEHPWSNITHTFLNLEGASSGGRPLLFRTTSGPPVLSFKNKHVPHPHANVLSSDAFARGVIRSGTDFSVYYDGRDMDGIDLAFYKGRSKYHTKLDAIPHTVGEKKALWAMMEAAKGSGVALANDAGRMHSKSKTPPVYFDLFGVVLIMFSLSSMITFNIVALVIGPIVLTLFLLCEATLQHNRRRQIQSGDPPARALDSAWSHFWIWLTRFRWLSGLWRWAKFWIALVITGALQGVLVFGYLKLNSFIVYSVPYIVFLSSFTLSYLSMVVVLNLPIPGMKARVPEQQKQTVIIQSYLFSWILLVGATVIGDKGVGGLYFVTAWNTLLFVACCIGSVEGMFGAQGTNSVVVVLQQPTPSVERSDHFEESDEHTPLIPRRKQDVTILGHEETGAIGWWILQMLILVPFPLILLSHISTMLISATAQTLTDGNSPTTVYAAIALLTTMMIIPLSPFTFKLHNGLTSLLLVVFLLTTAYNWLSFPFSAEAPLKLFFLQNVTITPGGTQTMTTLTGVSDYINPIISYLPSSTGHERICIDSPVRLGLVHCTWESDLLPAPTANFTGKSWLNATMTRTNKTSARVSVQGLNTRSCRIYFDNNAVTGYHVHGGAEGMQPRYEVSAGGAKELRLWSRTWERNFTVDVELLEEQHQTLGRVACEWNEYESGTVGIESSGKIPALEEVLTLLPKWAVVTKLADGLVEVSEEFTF